MRHISIAYLIMVIGNALFAIMLVAFIPLSLSVYGAAGLSGPVILCVPYGASTIFCLYRIKEAEGRRVYLHPAGTSVTYAPRGVCWWERYRLTSEVSLAMLLCGVCFMFSLGLLLDNGDIVAAFLFWPLWGVVAAVVGAAAMWRSPIRQLA